MASRTFHFTRAEDYLADAAVRRDFLKRSQRGETKATPDEMAETWDDIDRDLRFANVHALLAQVK